MFISAMVFSIQKQLAYIGRRLWRSSDCHFAAGHVAIAVKYLAQLESTSIPHVISLEKAIPETTAVHWESLHFEVSSLDGESGGGNSGFRWNVHAKEFTPAGHVQPPTVEPGYSDDFSADIKNNLLNQWTPCGCGQLTSQHEDALETTSSSGHSNGLRQDSASNTTMQCKTFLCNSDWVEIRSASSKHLALHTRMRGEFHTKQQTMDTTLQPGIVAPTVDMGSYISNHVWDSVCFDDVENSFSRGRVVAPVDMGGYVMEADDGEHESCQEDAERSADDSGKEDERADDTNARKCYCCKVIKPGRWVEGDFICFQCDADLSDDESRSSFSVIHLPLDQWRVVTGMHMLNSKRCTTYTDLDNGCIYVVKSDHQLQTHPP